MNGLVQPHSDMQGFLVGPDNRRATDDEDASPMPPFPHTHLYNTQIINSLHRQMRLGCRGRSIFEHPPRFVILLVPSPSLEQSSYPEPRLMNEFGAKDRCNRPFMGWETNSSNGKNDGEYRPHEEQHEKVKLLTLDFLCTARNHPAHLT